MALFQTSGGTPDDRRAEADRLYAMLEPFVGAMDHRETDFVLSCAPDEERSITPKMLFWLRDLKSKYAE